MSDIQFIWLFEERTFGVLIEMGAYFSRVRYVHGGIDYDIYVENDEFEFWEDHAIEYEE